MCQPENICFLLKKHQFFDQEKRFIWRKSLYFFALLCYNENNGKAWAFVDLLSKMHHNKEKFS
jgi:hypothetical protein